MCKDWDEGSVCVRVQVLSLCMYECGKKKGEMTEESKREEEKQEPEEERRGMRRHTGTHMFILRSSMSCLTTLCNKNRGTQFARTP